MGLDPNKPLIGNDRASVWLERQHRQTISQRIVDSPDIRAEHSSKGVALFLSNRSGGGGGTRVAQYVIKDFSAPDYFVCRALSAHVTRDPDNFDPPSHPRKITATAFDPDDVDEVARLADLETARAAELPRFDEGTTDIYIAKPYELRQTEFDDYQFALFIESNDDPDVALDTKTFQYKYLSATYRVAMDITDPDADNWTQENQTIIPRFMADETVIYAVSRTKTFSTGRLRAPLWNRPVRRATFTSVICRSY